MLRLKFLNTCCANFTELKLIKYVVLGSLLPTKYSQSTVYHCLAIVTILGIFKQAQSICIYLHIGVEGVWGGAWWGITHYKFLHKGETHLIADSC